ncbi:formate dehydrogenase accessory sulfurtransferase FdhD [soil metagenome]
MTQTRTDPEGVTHRAVLRLDRDARAEADDSLAIETPVALVFNGISHAVMMATPADLEDFARGFTLTEGLVDDVGDIYGIETVGGDRGIELQIEIASRMFVRLKERRRSMAGPTGCGLCGIDDLDALDLRPPRVVPPAWLADFDAAAIARAMRELAGRQPLNALTGGVHAAGWADPQGALIEVREDVGRHNALDKLLGALAVRKLTPDDGFVVMSSRASVELVRKCARLGVPLLATISAATSLAVEVATDTGVRLHGFSRGDRSVQYTI